MSMPLDSAVWRFEYGTLLNPPEAYEDSVVGTQIVDSITWTILKGLYGTRGIREDGMKIIYSENFSDSNSVVLFDFNLNAGDTLLFLGQHPIIVKAKKTIEVNGVDRLALEVENTFQNYRSNDTWVAGIGSLKMGISPLQLNALTDEFDPDPKLLCHTVRSEQIYAIQGNNCLYPLGTNLHHEVSELEVFPNPTVDQLTLNLGQHHEIATIHVMDTFGRIIQSKSMPSGQSIDLSSLTAGMYIIQVLHDGTIESRTFSKL